jgi:hypothetical protein
MEESYDSTRILRPGNARINDFIQSLNARYLPLRDLVLLWRYMILDSHLPLHLTLATSAQILLVRPFNEK